MNYLYNMFGSYKYIRLLCPMQNDKHCTHCNTELKFYEVADGMCCDCQIEQPYTGVYVSPLKAVAEILKDVYSLKTN